MSSRIDEIRRRHQDGPFGACETCELLAEMARVEAERDAAAATIDGKIKAIERLIGRAAASEQRAEALVVAGETVAIGLRFALDVADEPAWASHAFEALAAWSAVLAAAPGEGE